MQSTGLPPLAIPLLTLTGLGFVVLAGLNIGKLVTQRSDVHQHGRTSPLGNWAWVLSTISLLFPYLAPIALIMAGIDLKKIPKANKSEHFLRPSRMALINSVWALMTLIGILGLFLFRWTE